MEFHALELALRLIAILRRLIPRIRARDPKLAAQLKDAGSSSALNLGEGNRRKGRDKAHLWNVASGSVEEVRTGLRVAVAWGYLAQRDITEALAVSDSLQRMLWKLTQ